MKGSVLFVILTSAVASMSGEDQLLIVLIAIHIVSAFGIYMIARKKGFDIPLGWGVLGLIVPIIALICVLCKRNEK